MDHSEPASAPRRPLVAAPFSNADNLLPPSLDRLCDDALLRVLSYADLPSLVRVARGTSRALRRRFRPEAFGGSPDLWEDTFARLQLAPLEDGTNPRDGARGGLALLKGDEHGQNPDYLDAIRRRLALWATLSGNSRKRRKRSKQCFSLPSRMFHFVPLVPPDMMNYPPSSGGALEGDGNEFSFSYVDDGSENDGDEHEELLDMPIDADADANDELDQPDTSNMLGFDPPPVEFACDSFALTSPGTGAEFVLLNPFSGAVEVYDSVLDNAISSDEGMLEQALLDASEGIVRKRRGRRGSRRSGNEPSAHLIHLLEDDDFIPDESSEVIAGEAIHDQFNLHHKMYDTPPKRVLFSVDDYFDLDLDELFGPHTPFANSGRRERGSVSVDWVGVDSHTAMSSDCRSVAGNIIGAARILTMESEDRREEELACTEVFAWKDKEDPSLDEERYTSKYVCRAAGSFYFLDIDANYQKLYAAFQVGCCPYENSVNNESASRRDDRGGRQLMDLEDVEDESMVNDNGEPIRTTRAIYCLPLLRYDETSASCPEKIRSYFPQPDSCIVAQYPVSSFSVDPTGKILVVGTTSGTLEIWHTGVDPLKCHSAPMRLQILSVRESFMKRHRAMTMDERRTTVCDADLDCSLADANCDERPTSIEFDGNAAETQDDLALLENGAEEEELPHKHPTSKISQIYFPRHLPVHQCGFVTKQRSPEAGTTLLLWQTANMFSDNDRDSVTAPFRITAMINLPLSAQCHPEVHFDGRRLIVFGQDHIGLIFLVYHVLSTRFDQSEFDEAKAPVSPRKAKKSRGRGHRNGEESGGVVQIGKERRIKFVNRIRHAGLGGLEYFDSKLLSANERFLLVNTKSGNLIGSDGARNACEGLVVIDLEEHGF
ncbi:hypothetical protein ACHAXT_012460 [Thalassiosira profunda]